MRGASSFDGKMSGNVQTVGRYNESKGKKPAPGMRHPKAGGGESGGAHDAEGHDEIKQVVAEHGPAHSHMVIDRGEGHPDGRYHVVTAHEDGHVHHSDHETLGHAHAHAAHAHEDTAHLGDMDADDHKVAGEHEDMEDHSGSAGSSVGFMK